MRTLCGFSSIRRIYVAEKELTSLVANSCSLRLLSYSLCSIALKSIPWRLVKFCYNRGLQRPYTGTCTILQETVDRFPCPFITFLKSEAYQLNFE